MRRRARGVPGGGTEAREVVFGFEQEGIGLLVGEHILAERGTQRGEPLPDLGHALLGGGRKAGAGTAEGHLVALQNARLLAREPEFAAAVPQRPDPGVEAARELDAVTVRGEPRRHLALECQDGIVGVGAGQRVEDRRDLRQRAAAALQRRDGVIEARCLGIAGNFLDFRHVLFHGAVEGGPEMLRPDRCKGRRLGRPSPGAEQRIGAVWYGNIGGGHRTFHHFFKARMFQREAEAGRDLSQFSA